MPTALRKHLLLLCVLLAPADARATQLPADGTGGAPSVRAERLSGEAPALDGRLDEAAWGRAEAASSFTQRFPAPGTPATQRTEVRVLYDDAAIYVGMRLHDEVAAGIAAQLGRRDANGIYSDWAHVLIDSYHDRRTAFRFSVTPRGVQKDVLHYDDFEEDVNWDAVWEVATSQDEGGWTAEFRIPLSQLRFSPAEEAVWGINFGRDVARLSESAWWSPVLPGVAGFVSLAGELHGIRELQPPRRLEVLPYGVAQGSQVPVAGGDPFRTGGGRDGTLAFGGDVKYGLTSDVTLSATINPDFGQVEADPSVFNLSAQEVFFAERRPFFTEGSNIFGFGIGFDGGSGESLFYTRRIGRSPQRGLDGEHTDAPLTTTILGAAKMSGRTAGGWSVGFMDALTAEELGRTFEADSIGGYTVEPLTNYGVARLMKDFGAGRSRIGAIATSTHRRLGEDAGLSFLTDQAYAGGVDVRHRFGSDGWDFNGWLASSLVLGDTAAMQRLQRNSSRYYQRPDADHLAYDPRATSLAGYAGQLGLWRVAGAVRGGVGGTFRSPGFEVNDAGFQTGADLGLVYGNINYQRFEPIGPFRSVGGGFNPSVGWNFGGDRLHTQANVFSHAMFRNNWSVGMWGSRVLEGLSTGALRGGPAILSPGAWRGNVRVNTDSRNRVWLNAWSFWERSDERTGWMRNGGVNLNVRPSGAVDVQFGPSLNERSGDWQYVTQVEDAAGETRYVFAGFRQRTLSLTTRLSYTFTPALTLQLYAQPFITAGEYGAFREVVAPRAAGFADRFHVFTPAELTYVEPADPDGWGEFEVDRDADGTAEFSFGEPDFSFKELRSNLVLRWEYRPGSTLFLVWSQGRSRVDPTGRLDVRDDFDALLGAAGTNVLALKANYWLDF